MKYIKHISLIFLLFALVQCKSKKNDITNATKIVKGIVMDKFGPLGGALVKVKGTKREVYAGIDGKFEIEIIKGEILIVSSWSMENMEIMIDSKNYYEVVLTPYRQPLTRKMKRYIKREAKKNGGTYVVPD